jgi:hypothetical protein
MLKIGKALNVPLGGRTPILPQSQLQEMGFSGGDLSYCRAVCRFARIGERLCLPRKGKVGGGAPASASLPLKVKFST